MAESSRNFERMQPRVMSSLIPGDAMHSLKPDVTGVRRSSNSSRKSDACFPSPQRNAKTGPYERSNKTAKQKLGSELVPNRVRCCRVDHGHRVCQDVLLQRCVRHTGAFDAAAYSWFRDDNLVRRVCVSSYPDPGSTSRFTSIVRLGRGGAFGPGDCLRIGRCRVRGRPRPYGG